MFELDGERRNVHIPHPTDGEAGHEGPTRAPAARPSTSHLDTHALLHLQRMAGNASVVQMLADEQAANQEEQASPVHDVVGKGGGSPLDEGTRASMESSFGQDFSDVRVHTDTKASQSAESVGANAYTVGSDIVFRSGHFDTSSPTGQRTIAHELSHVVQQRSGPVEGTEAAGGIRLSDPSDRFERAADATADQVLSGSQAQQAPSSGSTGTAVQLEESEEDESGGGAVQREMSGGEQDDEEQGAGSTGG